MDTLIETQKELLNLINPEIEITLKTIKITDPNHPLIKHRVFLKKLNQMWQFPEKDLQ